MMPRVDDYSQAFLLGKQSLSGKDPDVVAGFAGAALHRENEQVSLTLNFLNRRVVIPWPDMGMLYQDSEEPVSIQQKVLLIHYLRGAWDSRGAPLTREWVAYQEVPDGRFYLDAFLKRAKMPLVQGFGENPETLVAAASQAYNGVPFDYGDVSVVLEALPLVPVALILWRGDEEFPPEGNILFDRNISRLLSAEDIAWLAGMVVYPLVGMARARDSKMR